MSDPLVSVVIPVFNRENYVAEAIESVLAQEHQPLELIVVDDGSTDTSAAVIRSYEPALRYAYQPNGGVASARNTGTSMATGPFLAFLDSDDIWLPGKLAAQLQVFTARPETDIVFGHAQQFYSPDLDAEARARIDMRREIIPAHLSSSMLIRLETFGRVGPYNEDLQVGIDMDWYARVLEKKMRVVMLPDVVYRRRLHATNLNGEVQQAMSARLHTLKAILDRRRQAG